MGRSGLAAVVVLLAALPSAAAAQTRASEPVVLTGAELGEWAVPAEVTARLPLMDLAAPPDDPHNGYRDPQLTTGGLPVAGKPVDRLLGFRWDGTRYVQIPFQVDEVFARYLDNSASGFAIYSGEDQHKTYAYDREGFRFTKDGPTGDPCRAQPASPPAKDPVRGLDHDDEVAFMWRDTGPQAPSGAALPAGVEALREVRLDDPLQAGTTRFAYVALAAATGGAQPAYTAANGYVDYRRDADADLFAKSESTYRDYGNAAVGTYCDDDGQVAGVGRRRPRDTATIRTDRYRFRYDGRWLMTELNVMKPDGSGYGRDLVDRWKARAFQQDPGSETPCCGFEDEDTNWGGSSTLLGEKAGPVRALRETWGADSGTNVIRRETFYRDELRQKTFLRVHPVPPLDGIYAQWDFNAGAVERFFTAGRPEGVAIDGRNDEVFGNLDDPCNVNYDPNDTSAIDQGYRTLYRTLEACRFPYHQSVDVPDLLGGSAPNAGLEWTVTSGMHGTVVDRISASAKELTPGGAAQSVLAVPYYRDDSCFDDGTGSDPGPKVIPRSGDEPRTYGDPPRPRRCWAPADGDDPQGSPEFFQGSIATHGLHLLAVAESDNLRQTVPLTEIVADWRMVMLPGGRLYDGTTGAAISRDSDVPPVTTVRPVTAPKLVRLSVTR